MNTENFGGRLFLTLLMMLLTLIMTFAGVQTVGAADITQNTAVVINSSNKATYHNKSIAGTVPADSYTGNGGTFVSQGAVVVEGIELNLTIDGFNVDYSVRGTPVSGISLMNGATLHLTVKGENTLTAGFGGAGIAVPAGCTLEITSESDGTLHATGGKSYGGGAGIGSIGNRNNTNQGSNFLFPQGLGTIIINGGTIKAQGGTWYDRVYPSGGAAGIGSSECSGATTTDTSWGGTTYLNNITGSITINGGKVTATGGEGAAGIGGGNTGTLQAITITGGTVTATPGSRAAAIGIGFNGFSSGSGTLTIPALSITGGTVTANGPLGFGEAIDDSQTLGASGTSIYRISYKLNGGKDTTANPTTYETGVGVASLAAPTYNGYLFEGWYDNADFNGTPVTSIPVGSTGNKTLYAKWTLQTYTITYEPNEGTMPSSYRTSYTVKTPTFNLPTPTRDSCYFRGWYLNEEFASAKYTQIKQGYEHKDRTFYAKWEKWDENGDGSRWNPYKIRNEEDLRDLAAKVNGGDKRGGVYYQQTADITITGGDWTPIGTSDHYFAGNYDGGGYTISGVHINSTGDHQGLFGYVMGTTDQHRGFIQNIILENSTIAGSRWTGGIVGRLATGHVLNCHVRSDVTVKASVNGTSSSPKLGFGGVVGYFYNGTVTDCTSMATVDKDGHKNVLYFGGIIGYMSQNSQSSRATATNCFSYGIVSIGERNSGTVTNVERVHKVQNIDGNVTLPDAVDVTDGFYYDGIGYYKPGVSVPLIVTPAPVGYDIEVKQESISSGTITTLTPDESGDYTFTVPNGSKTFTISATSHVSPLLGYTSSYTPDGTADKPYIINSTEGWNLMCDCLQDNTTWNRFSGKTVKLDDDIEVTRMAGSSQHDFTGTFDGNKKTLTVDYNTSEQYAAPFRNAENGCVIENLIVEGTIATSSQNAAGIIGNQFGTVTIRNCRVGVTIESSKEGDGTHGGIVAVKGNSNSAKLTIEGCVFDGKIVSTGSSATTLCGGFVGWKKDNGTLTIKNSLYAPQADDNAVSTGATFARNWTMPADANCYYTEVLGTAQGTEAYVYTPATTDFVPANVGAEGTTYDVSGITAYASGLKYNDRFYLEKASVSIANNADNSAAIVDKQVADVTLSGRKLFKDGGWNTLCLPFDLASLAGTPLEGATVKELDVTGTYDIDKQTGLKGTTLYLYFKDATAIKAGRPYIIRWDKAEGYEDDDAHNLVSPVFSGVTIDNTNRDVTFTGGAFKGTYAHISWDVETPSILFMGAGNKLNWPDVGASLGACRAYFLLADGASAREFKLNFGEETTGMSSLTPNPGLTPNPSPKGEGNFKGEGSDYWYSLDGRKVNGKPVRKGLYIYGGKKVAIK